MHGSGPDQVWESLKQLARRYASQGETPPAEQLERDLDAVISMHLGRSVDARLMTFYRRELEELISQYRGK